MSTSQFVGECKIVRFAQSDVVNRFSRKSWRGFSIASADSLLIDVIFDRQVGKSRG